MGMPDTAGKWTREMVLALPEDSNRYELFDGELLVTPAPTAPHQIAIAHLWEILLPFVRRHGLGRVLTSPADLSLGGQQLSQPDLFVVSNIPEDRSWSRMPNPILVVEVLSPSSARFDRITKRRRFQLAGIPEYWIVDLEARVVERWRPGEDRPEILDERLPWHPAGAPEPLEIELPLLFLDVWGKEA
jgi:Uma2 family endonuclease